MEYCGPIWQNASKCTLNKLDTIQRKVCHLIGKKHNSRFVVIAFKLPFSKNRSNSNNQNKFGKSQNLLNREKTKQSKSCA